MIDILEIETNTPIALPLIFKGRGEVKGFIFCRVDSKPTAYIYQVDNGNARHYEVFKHVVNTRFNRVSYPGAKQFGYWAWTYKTLDAAMERFGAL